MAEEAVSSAGYRAGTGEQGKRGIPLLFSSSLALSSIAAGPFPPLNKFLLCELFA